MVLTVCNLADPFGMKSGAKTTTSIVFMLASLERCPE
jgi:hypothetical protein